jgi:alkylation response protein AidB-like acyl-CoA dehydrogenase
MYASARTAEDDVPVDLLQRGMAWLASMPRLPLPGSGATLERWRRLARLAAEDVCLAKLLEAHYDAQAILAELGGPEVKPGELWAVWAAEPPSAQVSYRPTSPDAGVLHGTKAWCSGAGWATHALVTVREGAQRRLAGIDLRQGGVGPAARAWAAVGMARIVSGPLSFSGARAFPVGEPGAYLSRPGFWHGGAGIAACWYGAAVAIAGQLRAAPKLADAPHALAHLGAIETRLSSAAALLRETAELIDRQPRQPHCRAVVRLRCVMERVASDVTDRVGRALGPGPLCQDRAHAMRCSDLQVFVRQCHAERDLEALGRMLLERDEAPWAL